MTPARSGRAGGRRLAVAGLSLAAGAVLTACTAAVPAPSHTPPPVTSSSAPHSTPVPTTTHPRPRPSTTAPSKPRHTRTSSPPQSTSAAPPPPTSSVPPSPTPPPAPKSTCRSVSIRLIRGGAAQGTEIAALQFTNTGRATCTLVGYPQVVLLRHGNSIGSPSQPGGPYPGRAVQVQPGQTVQSLLRDYSSCQAPLSDSATVTAPNSTISTQAPAEMRACTLRVSQLGKPN